MIQIRRLNDLMRRVAGVSLSVLMLVLTADYLRVHGYRYPVVLLAGIGYGSLVAYFCVGKSTAA